jgi:hypothetical protein
MAAKRTDGGSAGKKSTSGKAGAPKMPRREERGRSVAVSPYPVPPRELAGKWVAWAKYEIVASGETLGEVMDFVAAEGIKGASYELIPSPSRGH